MKTSFTMNKQRKKNCRKSNALWTWAGLKLWGVKEMSDEAMQNAGWTYGGWTDDTTMLGEIKFDLQKDGRTAAFTFDNDNYGVKYWTR